MDYTISQKGERVTGTEISRKSVADMVIHLIENPSLHIRQSLGMNKDLLRQLLREWTENITSAETAPVS